MDKQIVVMEETEASVLRKRIFEGLKHKHSTDQLLRKLLHEFDTRRGWAVLGYHSLWKALEEGLEREFGISSGYVYKLIKQAEVERVLEIDQPISGKALSQFAKLDTDRPAQKRAYESARQRGGIAGVSEKLAKSAVKHAYGSVTESVPGTETVTLCFDSTIELLERAIQQVVKRGGPTRVTVILADAVSELKEYQNEHA